MSQQLPALLVLGFASLLAERTLPRALQVFFPMSIQTHTLCWSSLQTRLLLLKVLLLWWEHTPQVINSSSSLRSLALHKIAPRESGTLVSTMKLYRPRMIRKLTQYRD